MDWQSIACQVLLQMIVAAAKTVIGEEEA